MAPTPGKEHIAETLLARAHSPDTTSTIFKERIKQKPLLLRPSSPDRRKSSTDARQKRRQAREAKLAAERKKSRKPKPLSAKRKRALCLYEIPTEQRKYSIYVPLHAMWCEYMRDILGFSSSDGDGARGGRAQYMTGTSAGPVLVSADYHGSLAEVVRSRCASRVGLKGIVVKDTKFTFDIITEKDELKTVPKEHSVFRFEVPLITSNTASAIEEAQSKPLVFEIHGSQFQNRAPDRVNKKFKQHIDPDL